MLSGATCSAAAIAGTAVFRIVVSSDSMKKATATSQGSNRLLELSTDSVSVASIHLVGLERERGRPVDCESKLAQGLASARSHFLLLHRFGQLIRRSGIA